MPAFYTCFGLVFVYIDVVGDLAQPDSSSFVRSADVRERECPLTETRALLDVVMDQWTLDGDHEISMSDATECLMNWFCTLDEFLVKWR